jgi:hypothetical protein
MLKQQNVNQFNNALPVEVEVLAKTDYIRYLLKLGRKELTTKSYKELEIGAKYLAQLSNSKDGMITLSRMRKLPRFLQQELAINVEFEILKNILQDKTPIKFFKQSIIDGLKIANDKEQFSFLVKLLMSLEQNVLTIPFSYMKKSNIFQKKYEKACNITTFYITFNTIGPVSGTIQRDKLIINTQFKSVKYSLEKNYQNIHAISRIEINVTDDIEPLYQLNENLINISG